MYDYDSIQMFHCTRSKREVKANKLVELGLDGREGRVECQPRSGPC